MTLEGDRIEIPKTKRGLTKRLTGIHRLLTATKLERAAIVWAWTYDGRKDFHGNRYTGSVENGETTGLYTCEGFARLGIAGLRGDQAVRKYREAWQMAIDAKKAPEVQPGDSVEIPPLCHCGDRPDVTEKQICTRCGELRWPPMRTGSTRDEWLREDATLDEKVSGFKEVMKKDPEFHDAVQNEVIDEITEDPALLAQVWDRYSEKHPNPESDQDAPEPMDLLHLSGIGSSMYTAIRRHSKELEQIMQLYEDRELSPQDQELITEMITDMDRCKTLIDEFQEHLRSLNGRDTEATFRRLLG